MCTSLPVCLPVITSLSLPVFLSVLTSVYLCFSTCISLPAPLYLCLSTCGHLYLCLFLSVSASTCFFQPVSLCLSVCTSLYLCLFTWAHLSVSTCIYLRLLLPASSYLCLVCLPTCLSTCVPGRDGNHSVTLRQAKERPATPSVRELSDRVRGKARIVEGKVSCEHPHYFGVLK